MRSDRGSFVDFGAHPHGGVLAQGYGTFDQGAAHDVAAPTDVNRPVAGIENAAGIQSDVFFQVDLVGVDGVEVLERPVVEGARGPHEQQIGLDLVGVVVEKVPGMVEQDAMVGFGEVDMVGEVDGLDGVFASPLLQVLLEAAHPVLLAAVFAGGVLAVESDDDGGAVAGESLVGLQGMDGLGDAFMRHEAGVDPDVGLVSAGQRRVEYAFEPGPQGSGGVVDVQDVFPFLADGQDAQPHFVERTGQGVRIEAHHAGVFEEDNIHNSVFSLCFCSLKRWFADALLNTPSNPNAAPVFPAGFAVR